MTINEAFHPDKKRRAEIPGQFVGQIYRWFAMSTFEHSKLLPQSSLFEQ